MSENKSRDTERERLWVARANGRVHVHVRFLYVACRSRKVSKIFLNVDSLDIDTRYTRIADRHRGHRRANNYLRLQAGTVTGAGEASTLFVQNKC